MANDEHVAMLKQWQRLAAWNTSWRNEQVALRNEGLAAWNAWRDENPDIRPDLSGAHLKGADLSEAQLAGVDFGEACLDNANLSWTNLRGGEPRWGGP